jgi:hypothetical protein
MKINAVWFLVIGLSCVLTVTCLRLALRKDDCGKCSACCIAGGCECSCGCQTSKCICDCKPCPSLKK